MSNMSITGLASGLDSSSIVKQLMQLEARPQTMLKTQKTQTDSFVTALQSLSAKLSSMGDAAKALTGQDSFARYKATSSSDHAGASAGTNANVNDIEFKVNQLARGQSSISEVVATGHSFISDGKVNFTTGSGDNEKHWSVDVAGSGGLSDVASAINSTNSGLRASVITTNEGQRLQLTNTNTGAEQGRFTITSGNAGAELRNTVEAQDAEIELWPGQGISGSTIRNSTNLFENVAEGVAIKVNKVHQEGEDATRISVNKDAEGIQKLASNLVSQVGLVLGEISSRSKVTTNSSGSVTTTSGGLFTSDSTARSLTNRITEALGRPVNGMSPSSIGIEIQRDGTFTFDEEKFAAAYAADSAGTEAFLAELGNRVNSVTSAAADKYTGELTRKIESQQSLSKSYDDQIESWDRRLALKEQTLSKTYANLEVLLSGMQSQQSNLTQQLSSLNTWA